jgi:hypothetical protein
MPTDSIISGLQNLPHFYYAAGAGLKMTINMDADFSLTGKICEVSIAPKEKKPLRAFTLTSADANVSISGQVVTIDIDPTKETAPAFTGGWTLGDVQAAGETELAISFYDSGQPVDLRLQGNVTWVAKGGEFEDGEAVVSAPDIDVTVVSGVVSVSVSVPGIGSVTLDTNTSTSGLSGILKAASNSLDVAVAGTDFVAANDSRLTDARTPTSHVHGNISNAGAIGSTSGLPIKTGTSGVLEAGAFGTSAGQFAEGNHSHAQLHDRSHAITSTSDHTAGNWKVFYSNGSGAVTELALGASGKVLQSNGTSAAPTWETAGGGSGDVVGPALAVTNNFPVFDGTTGKLIKDSGLALTPGAAGVQEVYELDFSLGPLLPNLYASEAYVLMHDENGSVCLWWYDSINQNSQPSGTFGRFLQVNIDSSVDALSDALSAACATIQNDSKFNATLASDVITVTLVYAGAITNATINNITSASINVTTNGVDAGIPTVGAVNGAAIEGLSVSNLNTTGTASASTFLNGDGAWVAISEVTSNDRLASLGLVIDGAGSAITTGVKGYLRVPYNCDIQSVEIVADQSGSIVIDIWRDTYANFPPTVADSIVASAKPTLSSAQKSQNTTLTGWTKALTEGQYLAFNVDSVSTVTRVVLTLKVQKG